MAEPQKLPSIYGLFDASGALRYIGKANDPAKRLKGHMREVRRRRTPLYDWLTKHGEPEMRILEANCSDWEEAERRLISEARARGDRLLNVADGGDEPHCPIEVRRANGRNCSRYGGWRLSSGHPATAANRSRNGKALNARIKDDPQFAKIVEWKRTIAAGLRAGLVSEGTRAKLRLAAQKRPDLFGCWANI